MAPSCETFSSIKSTQWATFIGSFWVKGTMIRKPAVFHATGKRIFIEVPCIFVYIYIYIIYIYCIWKNQLMHIDLLKVNKLKYNYPQHVSILMIIFRGYFLYLACYIKI
jgi:hypothetical protein